MLLRTRNPPSLHYLQFLPALTAGTQVYNDRHNPTDVATSSDCRLARPHLPLSARHRIIPSAMCHWLRFGHPVCPHFYSPTILIECANNEAERNPNGCSRVMQIRTNPVNTLLPEAMDYTCVQAGCVKRWLCCHCGGPKGGNMETPKCLECGRNRCERCKWDWKLCWMAD